MPSSLTASAVPDHRYRPEIDGLRALAVLPVVLFHAGVGGLSGGFVGVDIFFVISGYLITGILYREVRERRFSILTFYERRVRRIVPNLLAALAVTTAAALVILIPVDLKLYAQSLVATLAFAANIFFWIEIGYFTPSADQFPLLHMWSLGVEEQYYLLFPLLMMAVAGPRGRWLKPVLWVLFILSLVMSCYQTVVAPDAAFYLPFGRLWELMAGSLLAVGAIPAIASGRLRAGLGWVGLAAILVAIALYDADTRFPGLAALLPCLGAVAIIHGTAAGPTVVGRLLSTRPMVFVGAISYSLYIWHWPIMVFTRYCLQRALTPVEILLVLAATLLVAIAAWRWIEQPWRQRTVSLRQLLGWTGTGAAVLACGAAFLIVSAGWPGRYPARVQAIALAPADTNPMRGTCDRPSIVRSDSGDVCRIGVAGVPSFALVGDSFGDAVVPGVDQAAREAGLTGLVLTQSGCAPLVGVNEPGSPCRAEVEAMYALIRRTSSIRAVLLVGRWPAMVEGRRFGFTETKRIRLVDDADPVGGERDNAAVMARGFARSIASAAPARMTILTGLPEQRVNVPQAATVRSLFGGDLGGVMRDVYAARQAQTSALLAGVASNSPVRIIDAQRWLCGPRDCPIVAEGRALYVDDNHLSRYAVRARRGLFADALRAPRPDQAAAKVARR